MYFFVIAAFLLVFATTPYLLSDSIRDGIAIIVVLAFIAIVLVLPLSKRI